MAVAPVRSRDDRDRAGLQVRDLDPGPALLEDDLVVVGADQRQLAAVRGQGHLPDHPCGGQDLPVPPADQVQAPHRVQAALAVAVLQVVELLAQVAPWLVAAVLGHLVVEGTAVGCEHEGQHTVLDAGHGHRFAARGRDPPHLAAAVVGRFVAAGVVAAQEPQVASIRAPGHGTGDQAAEGQAPPLAAVAGHQPEVTGAAFLAGTPAALGVGDPGAVRGDGQAAQADQVEIVPGHDVVGAVRRRGQAGAVGGHQDQHEGQQERSHGANPPGLLQCEVAMPQGEVTLSR